MSKPAALFVATLLSFGAHAAPGDGGGPGLRLSEQLDMRRLGHASDTERAVLRVEWQSARSGVDEALAVEDMLARLQRMSITVGEIQRMVVAMPMAAEKPAVAPVEAGDADAVFLPSFSSSERLAMLAGSASLIAVLALWWARRPGRRAPSAPTPSAATHREPVVTPATLPPMPPPAPAPRPEPAPMPAAKPLASPSPEAVPAPAPPPVQVAPPAPPVPPAPAPEAPDAAESPNIIEFTLEENPHPTPEPATSARPATENTFAAAVEKSGNVDETLELAEIMLSMGLAQGAAQALTEHIRTNPRQALYHWLKLLDVHKKSGNKDQFEEAARELRQNFNIQAEDWSKVGAGETPTLEGFPRIAAQVQELWSRPAECADYLSRLLEDNRGGSRAGFPRPVAEEILLLIAVLKETPAQAEGV